MVFCFPNSLLDLASARQHLWRHSPDPTLELAAIAASSWTPHFINAENPGS
jgi:hypothetical protein